MITVFLCFHIDTIITGWYNVLLDTYNDEIRVISMFINSNMIHLFVEILLEIPFLCYFEMHLICLVTMVTILYIQLILYHDQQSNYFISLPYTIQIFGKHYCTFYENINIFFSDSHMSEIMQYLAYFIFNKIFSRLIHGILIFNYVYVPCFLCSFIS